MKKTLFLSMFLLFLFNCFAITTPNRKEPLATEMMLPLLNSNHQISLYDFSHLSAKEYRKITGRKLGWLKALELKLVQKKLRESIREDGTVNTTEFKKAWGESDFHWGGYLLGLLLGPLGIIITYFINDDYKRERRKWAWWGFLAFLSILLLAASLAMAA